ncbi:flagellin [Hydrogenophaga sp.]|uniref:flagellin n=1 Tax=Hydrogenophaga sp. TaxID=1904254 RepID=UPI003458E645
MGSLTATVDTAIATIADFRSNLGAMSNRLGHNIANLQSQSENLSASMSRITDADYAAETATLSKNQVMQQAATAMLAQANQMPNAVLTLLQ